MDGLPQSLHASPVVRPRCSTCGSDDIVTDAWAGWDAEAQCWTLDAVFDHAVCNRCETATTLTWSTPMAGAPQG